MFRENRRHLQHPLFSDLDNLSKKARTRLEASWAGVFRRECFGRINERPFAVLFSDEDSRPNTPVNVIVGLETLKSAFGWSDQQMHDAFLFNMQARYAVGYDNLGEGDFDLRTVYNFRHRLSDHMQRTGENLLDAAFVQITDDQLAAFQLKTGRLRVDSTQIASNIRRMSRMQLLVEVLQRVHRILDDADQVRYADAFAPYLKGSSGQYIYHLKGEDTGPHLQRIGELMHRLLAKLAPSYESHETYQMLRRVFHEQFILDENPPQPKPDDEAGGDPTGHQPANKTTASADTDQMPMPAIDLAADPAPSEEVLLDEPSAPVAQARPGKDISPNSLHSPDDPEATYRRKGHQAYQGYVVNLTETCDPDNSFQLIVKVQTEPNITEDTTLLEQALPELKARTNVHTLYNDAGFCGPNVDQVLHKLKVEQVPTSLRGSIPDPSRTRLADCEIQLDADRQPVKLICPHQYTATVTPGRKEGRYIARWTNGPCPECRLSNQHAGRKPSTTTFLRFSRVDLDRALRRQRMCTCHLGNRNLRAAVEATVGALKRPFSNDQAPVRGKIRLSQMMIGSAAMVNIRRIQRYLQAKSKPNRAEHIDSSKAERPQRDTGLPVSSFLPMIWARFQRWLLLIRPARAAPVFGSWGFFRGVMQYTYGRR